MTEITEASCPDCGIGRLRLHRVPYLTVSNEQIVHVPGFPAWICDVCGWRAYDPPSLAELQALLRFGRRRPLRPRPPRSGDEDRPDTAPLDSSRRRP